MSGINVFMTKKHVSPFFKSITDLTKNKLSVVGFSVVLAVSILCVFAPIICSNSPTQIHPWIGSRSPGYQSPPCLSENVFTVGLSPETSIRVLGYKALNYTVKRSISERLRIVVKRGNIHKLTLLTGAKSLMEYDLNSGFETAWELNESDERGRRLPEVNLKIGEPVPEGLMNPGQRVMIVQLIKKADDEIIRFEFNNEIVKRIRRDGTEIDKISLKGESITSIRTDSGNVLRMTFLLGTDELGRDLFSRILYGGRISLLIGIVATAVSLLIGVCYGAISGYSGGKIDQIMMNIIDILYAIPFMFLVIILLVLFGRNIVILFIALGAVQWLTMARIVRGQIFSLKEKEFVDAARVCGASSKRIIFYHLIPNAIGPIIVYATLTVPVVILEESFLAFIGLSVQFNGQNLDSWGSLVQQGMLSLGTGGERYWLLIGPSLTMALTLFGLNCLGDGLRDCFDPKTKSNR